MELVMIPDPRDCYAPNSLPKANGELLVHMGPVFASHTVEARRVGGVADDVVIVRIISVQLINKVLSPLRAPL